MFWVKLFEFSFSAVIFIFVFFSVVSVFLDVSRGRVGFV